MLAVDDLQWADPPLLDLLDHLAEAVRDAPLLLLGTARPELFDDRPGWLANAVPLNPLPDAHADDLLRRLAGSAPIGADVRNRILEVAEGNPLFVVELVAMAEDGGQALTDVALPPTIQALLAARLDRLPRAERTVLEAGAIEGKEFAAEHVRALVDERALDATLGELVRKGLIEPAGEAFRFHHQLLRDAAYEGIPKHARADLHARFAAALEARLAPATADELLGYHRERAVLLRRELGETDAATARLAAISLGAAARRAAQREDSAAACALLERALALVPDDAALRGTLLPALGAALFESGEMAAAIRVLDAAIIDAPDLRWRTRAGVEREFARLESETYAGTERALHVADAALRVFEHERDTYGQCRAWGLRAKADWLAGSVGRAEAEWDRAAEFAQRAGDERELFVILGWHATAAVLGPTPVDDAIARCETFRDRVGASPVAVAWMVNPLASLHAMRGDFARARQCLQEANEVLRELAGWSGFVSHHEALVHLLAGRPDLAEQPLRAGMRKLEPTDDRGLLATTAAMLAQSLYAQERWTEAGELCEVAADEAAADDVVTQVIWRGVRAKLLARERAREAAEELAREAVSLIEPTDLLTHRADALLDLAAVIGKDAYQHVVEAALVLYELKGNAVGAARARALLGFR